MKKIIFILLTIILTLTQINAKEVSLEKKITSLYISFFSRAADLEGLDYWKSQGTNAGGDGLSVLKRLSKGFAKHPIFTSKYAHLDNEEFVQAIYRNSLGKEGDSAGVAYWKSLIENGKSRSDMVAEFMETSLTADMTRENFPTLSQADLDAGVERQNRITNKVEVAVYFTNSLKAMTNIKSNNPENDPAYLASIKVISEVNENSSSVDSAIGKIRGLGSSSNAISAINDGWDKLGNEEENNCGFKIEFDKNIEVNEDTRKLIYPSKLSYSSLSCRKREYEWKQLSGIKTDYISDKNSSSIQILFPQVEKDELVKFRFTVKATSGKMSKEIDILIKNIPESAECIRYFSTELTQNDIDTSNEKVKAIADILEITDPNNGYQLFLRNNKDFMIWIDMGTSLSTAIHEANHMIDSSLRYNCTPKGKAKYFSLGDIYTTDLIWDKTEHYSIVEESIPSVLKTTSRYDIYILGMKEANGNTFQTLLDELNAYIGDAYFQINFRKSELEKNTNHYNAYGQFQIGGVVNFMVYLEYYLKTARLNYPEAHEHINQQNTIDYIQYLWSMAEEILIKSYPYLMENRNSKYIFFTLDEKASGLEHLKVAYSDEVLLELDSLGISHRDYDFWQSTYFDN